MHKNKNKKNHMYNHELFYPQSSNHLRCRDCNRVSSGEIAGPYGEYSSGAFFTDPEGLGYICYECYMSVESVLSDFDLEDEYDEE